VTRGSTIAQRLSYEQAMCRITEAYVYKKLSYRRNSATANSCCFTSNGSYKGSKQQQWPTRSFKGIGNGAIRQTTYDFLLAFHFHCNYVSILHRFRDNLFPKM